MQANVTVAAYASYHTSAAEWMHHKKDVLTERIELPTLVLLAPRSNQLSYASYISDRIRWQEEKKRNIKTLFYYSKTTEQLKNSCSIYLMWVKTWVGEDLGLDHASNGEAPDSTTVAEQESLKLQSRRAISYQLEGPQSSTRWKWEAKL